MKTLCVFNSRVRRCNNVYLYYCDHAIDGVNSGIGDSDVMVDPYSCIWGESGIVSRGVLKCPSSAGRLARKHSPVGKEAADDYSRLGSYIPNEPIPVQTIKS